MQIEEDVIGRGKIFKNFCHFLQVSLPRRGNLTSVIYLLPAFLCAHIFIERETSGYEAERTQWNTGSAFRISFHLYWPIDNGFTTSQSWRVPKSWYTGEEGWRGGGEGAEKGFRRRFAEGVNQSLVSSVAQASSALPKQLIKPNLLPKASRPLSLFLVIACTIDVTLPYTAMSRCILA